MAWVIESGMSRPLKRVSKKELRDLFNRRAYCEQNQIGEIEEDIERSRDIAQNLCRKLGMPPGSQSQIVAYRLPGIGKIALVHQYVHPDGSVRGKPDPKYLVVGGVIHALHLKPPPSD
jgi:hypothetical protein